MHDERQDEIDSARGEMVLYTTEDGRTRVECRFVEENLWLSQRLIAELFQKNVRTINEHLQNIVEEGELDPSATVRKFRIVQREGDREVTRAVEHYSLEAILAVGYRVRSPRGTQFRRWATARLSELEDREPATIQQVNSHNDLLVRHAYDPDRGPDVRVKVGKCEPPKGPRTVPVFGTRRVIDPQATRSFIVDPAGHFSMQEVSER